MVSNIHWLGHASFRIEGNGLVIYIDAWELEDGAKGDLILITHDHHDHCSLDEAVEAVKAIRPQIAIPMHVGRHIGSLVDAKHFKEKASVPVQILPVDK